MLLQLSYFYGEEAEQYSFYRIPKIMFTDACYKTLSIAARVLYGLMLDRMGLSIRNGWLDNQNRVYIIFTLDEAIDMLGFGHNKVVKLFQELEGIGLIERKRQGQGRPTLIYVKNFIAPDKRADGMPINSPLPPPPDDRNCGSSCEEVQTSQNGKSWIPGVENSDFPMREIQVSQARKARLPTAGSPGFPNQEVQTSQTGKSSVPQTGSLDFSKGEANKTDKNHTDLNETLSILSAPFSNQRTAPVQGNGWMDRMDSQGEMVQYRELLQDNIGYDQLVQERPFDLELFDGYVELMAEVCASKRASVRIGGQELPTDVVRSRFLKLDGAHIRYVMESMTKNTTQIKNIRAYTLAALYNAPTTMAQYYVSQVSHDLSGDGQSNGHFGAHSRGDYAGRS